MAGLVHFDWLFTTGFSNKQKISVLEFQLDESCFHFFLIPSVGVSPENEVEEFV
jgi:hypothetical protein